MNVDERSGVQTSRDEWIRRYAQMRDERDQLAAAIERVRKLHPALPMTTGSYCGGCTTQDELVMHPCPTLDALDDTA